jgi:hypothetical protein
MNKTHSIQLKAAFLLTIFSLNIVVGFACAIGVDMGFNAAHHHEKATVNVHIHADGKKHHHKEVKHKHSHKGGKDDCCNDRVTKISQADKAIPQSSKILSPAFFIAFTAAFYNINISYPSQAYISNKYFVRGNHPPISDIRIAIQSFQI